MKRALTLDADGMFRFGEMHFLGQDAPKDYGLARKWFLEASRSGHAAASYRLGLMHDRGLGFSEDTSEAMKWYLRAAIQGNDDARYTLGEMYHFGRGAAQDVFNALAVNFHRFAPQKILNFNFSDLAYADLSACKLIKPRYCFKAALSAAADVKNFFALGVCRRWE